MFLFCNCTRKPQESVEMCGYYCSRMLNWLLLQAVFLLKSIRLYSDLQTPLGSVNNSLDIAVTFSVDFSSNYYQARAKPRNRIGFSAKGVFQSKISLFILTCSAGLSRVGWNAITQLFASRPFDSKRSYSGFRLLLVSLWMTVVNAFSGITPPTIAPTPLPTMLPTVLPTRLPTVKPTSDMPSAVPTLSFAPVAAPTAYLITAFAGANSRTGNPADNIPATSASFSTVNGLWYDTQGFLYIADKDGNKVRRVTTGTVNIITTFCGNGTGATSGNGGPVAAATLYGPNDVWGNSIGYLYILEARSYVVREVRSGIIYPFAGTVGSGYHNHDGWPASAASLGSPYALMGDTIGNVYITEDAYIRKVAAVSGIISTLAGAGSYVSTGDGGQATAANVNFAQGIFVETTGIIYIADDSGSTIRKIAVDGIITTIVGTDVTGFNGDGLRGTATQVDSIIGIVGDTAGNLYFSDSNNNRFREFSTAGFVYTVAGTGTSGSVGDGGMATAATLHTPTFSAIDTQGDFYFTCYGVSTVRYLTYLAPSIAPTPIPTTMTPSKTPTIAPTVKPTTFSPSSPPVAAPTAYVMDAFAGIANSFGSGPDGGLASTTQIESPRGVWQSTLGVVYFADYDACKIRSVDTSNIISTFAGTGNCSTTGNSGPATSAHINGPWGVWGNSVGQVYFVEATGDRIRKVSGGVVTNYAGTGPHSADSGDNGPATSANLYSVTGIKGDTSGNLYVAELLYIRMISATGIITRIAGNGLQGNGGDGGAPTAAYINGAGDVFVDTAVNVYFTNSQGNSIRVADYMFTNKITTVVGNGNTAFNGDGQTGTATNLNFPYGLSEDSQGFLTFTDGLNYRVRTFYTHTNLVYTIGGSGAVSFTGNGGAATAASLLLPLYVFGNTGGNFYVSAMDDTVRLMTKLVPTLPPTPVPTKPTLAPSAAPTTTLPSRLPSVIPTITPSAAPSVSPTVVPSISPSRSPTVSPSVGPTVTPSDGPTMMPSVKPSIHPTESPTVHPTEKPTVHPTERPSVHPSERPTVHPTEAPTVHPTERPTVHPSEMPTLVPSEVPSVVPSDAPTEEPTVHCQPSVAVGELSFIIHYGITGISLSTLANSTVDQELLVEAIRENMWTSTVESELFNITIVLPSYTIEGYIFLEFNVSIIMGQLNTCSYHEVYNTVVETLSTHAQQEAISEAIINLATEEENDDMIEVHGNLYVTFSNLMFLRGPTDAPTPAPTCAPIEYGAEISFLFIYSISGISQSTLEFNSADQDILLDALRENLWPDENVTSSFDLQLEFPAHSPTQAPLTRRSLMDVKFVKESYFYFTVVASVLQADLMTCSEPVDEVFATIQDTFNANAENGAVTDSIQSIAVMHENYAMHSVVGASSAYFFNLSYVALYPSYSPTCAPHFRDLELEMMLTLNVTLTYYTIYDLENDEPAQEVMIEALQNYLWPYEHSDSIFNVTIIFPEVDTPSPTTAPSEAPTISLFPSKTPTKPPSNPPTVHPTMLTRRRRLQETIGNNNDCGQQGCGYYFTQRYYVLGFFITVRLGSLEECFAPISTFETIERSIAVATNEGNLVGYMREAAGEDAFSFYDMELEFNQLQLVEELDITYSPTEAPIAPTISPSDTPTYHPTTTAPSERPTVHPTEKPTVHPTESPTVHPTEKPTVHPSEKPTVHPTEAPTIHPTEKPTVHPTERPTVHPSESPTVRPTLRPTVHPTEAPSVHPTESPTVHPSEKPTVHPTESPTVHPTEKPTVYPTERPTVHPSEKPTVHPTEAPTVHPTERPTVHPTEHPSIHPSEKPTVHPTESPTVHPTEKPTVHPTEKPTVHPTESPTIHPTEKPTVHPTEAPTVHPSEKPTVTPTVCPTILPSIAPSVTPTLMPSLTPTVLPSIAPTVLPSIAPTTLPSVAPSQSPSVSPTEVPSQMPSISPSEIPSQVPSDSPTVWPTQAPSCPESSFDDILTFSFLYGFNGISYDDLTNSTEDQSLLLEAVQENLWRDEDQTDLFNVSMVVVHPTSRPTYPPYYDRKLNSKEGNYFYYYYSNNNVYAQFFVEVVLRFLDSCDAAGVYESVVSTFNCRAADGSVSSSISNLAYLEQNYDMIEVSGKYDAEFNNYVILPSAAPTPSPTCSPLSYDTEIVFEFVYGLGGLTFATLEESQDDQDVLIMAMQESLWFDKTISEAFNISIIFPTPCPTPPPSDAPSQHPMVTERPSETPSQMPSDYPNSAPVSHTTRRLLEKGYYGYGEGEYYMIFVHFRVSVLMNILGSCSETVNDIFYEIEETFNNNAEDSSITDTIQAISQEQDNSDMYYVYGGPYGYFTLLSSKIEPYPTGEPSVAPTCGPQSYDVEMFFTLDLGIKGISLSDFAGSSTDQFILTEAVNDNLWTHFEGQSYPDFQLTLQLPTSAPSRAPTMHPTRRPTISMVPTHSPFEVPTQHPMDLPTQHPVDSPTQHPTQQPVEIQNTARRALMAKSNGFVVKFQVSVFVSALGGGCNVQDTLDAIAAAFSGNVNSGDFETDIENLSEEEDTSDMLEVSVTSSAFQMVSTLNVYPSVMPSEAPSAVPSVVPSEVPSQHPTVVPTLIPSVMPSIAPSQMPTVKPSVIPTQSPTVQPSVQPSRAPTIAPSIAPSQPPTLAPSVMPTTRPTLIPSQAPSQTPTVGPSIAPSDGPSASPSVMPSEIPTVIPSENPTMLPSVEPSIEPSTEPSVSPSQTPSASPTIAPSLRPTVKPTRLPSRIPSRIPSVTPTSPPSEETGVQTDTLVSFTLDYEVTGVSLASLQQSPAEQHVLEDAVQDNLWNNQTQAQGINVTIASMRNATTGVHRLRRSLATTGVSLTFRIQFLLSLLGGSSSDATAVYNFIVSYFNFQAGNNTVTESIRILAEERQIAALVNVIGASSATFSPFTTTAIYGPTLPPTSSPTQWNTHPRIASIGVTTKTSDSISVTVTFHEATLENGYVYCAALLDGTDVSSISQVTVAATPQYYLSGATSVSLVIKNLIAVTNYDIYGYAQSTSGLGSYINEVLATRFLNVTTPCCKNIELVNAPASVYSDVNVYSEDVAPTSYLFTFQLSAVPKHKVVVTPVVLYSNLTRDRSVTAVPPSTTFTPASTDLSSSFYLSANSVTEGTHVVFLNVTEDSPNSEYSTDQAHSVNMLATQATVPPPKLSFCQFSDSGAFVYIAFDSATDYAGMSASSSWSCDTIFSFHGASDNTCVWLNSTVVKSTFPVYTPNSYLLDVGDNVTVLANKVKAQCVQSDCSNYQYNSASTVPATQSKNPVSPVPVLVMPSILSSCNDLVIDATLSLGSGGRYWTKSNWTVIATTNSSTNNTVYHNTADIVRVLNTYNVLTTKITLASSSLHNWLYSFSLTVTNFLGHSGTVSATVLVVGNINSPTLTILGSSLITVNPSEAATVYAKATSSVCSSNPSISYAWTINLNGVNSGIVSASNAPSTLVINPYTLTIGNIYQAVITATVPTMTDSYPDGIVTALATIVVVKGDVVAVIKGGYYRAVYISPADPLILDASVSYDEDVNPADSDASDNLNYLWTCRISSILRFRDDCSFIFGGQSNTTSQMVLSVVNTTFTYAVSVLVTAADGRSDSAVVTVQNQESTSATGPYTYVSSAVSKFNIGSPLTIRGTVQGDYALQVAWSTSVSGEDVSFTALTTTPYSFTASEVVDQISYPLAISTGSFVGGTEVTFKLLAQKFDDSSLFSYSVVTLTANAAPSGGSLSVSPSEGVPLVQVFSLLSTGWIDDPSDYPLTYDFQYSLSTLKATIKSRSTSSSTFTTLPSGMESVDFEVTLYARVYDAFLAVGSVSQTVTVGSNTTFNVSNYIADSLTSASATGDTDLTIQVVNNGANTLNVVNCSLATPGYCEELYRNECDSVPNTCGECFDYAEGISGPSNTRCWPTYRGEQEGGESPSTKCESDCQCLYSYCVNNTCSIPNKDCYTSIPGTTCSGHGHCSLTDPSGNEVSSCLITDTYCTATCICEDGYGGTTCDLTPEALAERDSSRTQCCQAITNVLSQSNPSFLLLESLVNALYVSYTPGEVVTGIQDCWGVLTSLSSLIADGYLVGADNSLSGVLVNAASDFVSANGSSQLTLTSAVHNISEGLLLQMADGQSPTTFVTDNLRFSLIRYAVSALSSYTFSPPSTVEEATYGTVQPSLSFAVNSSDSLSACDTGYGYVRLSVLNWGNSPNSNSSQVTTRVFATQSFTSLGDEVDSSRRSRRLTTGTFTNSSRTEDLNPDDAVFYLTLQFSTKQDFDFTLDPSDPNAIEQNVTFPFCNLFDGTRYVPCDGCNISSYTNYNVTYACSDVSLLCNAGDSARRRVSSNDLDERFIQQYYHRIASGDRRSLFTLSGDDDGTSSNSGVATSSQFGAILGNVEKEIKAVLSVNIFAINPKRAAPILACVLFLFLLFAIGLVAFMRWDRLDHDTLIYSKIEKERTKREQARRLLEDYYMMRQSSNKERQQVKFLTTLRNRKSGIIDRAILDRDDRVKVIQRQQNLSYDTLEDTEKAAVDEVNTFLSLVMPVDHKVLKNERWQFSTALMEQHEYINMFSYPSIYRNRTTRWVNICMSVAICMMLDTLFFGQFYSDRGQCEVHVNDQEACLKLHNAASNANECKWHPDTSPAASPDAGTCVLVSPPNSVVFTVIIMTLTIVIGVPITFLFDLILDEVCSKRPAFEKIGWSSHFFLNSQSQVVLHGNNETALGLKDLFRDSEQLREADAQLSGEQEETDALRAKELHDINLNALRIYHSTVSAEEEVDQIYTEVGLFMQHYNTNMDVPPWKTTSSDYVRLKARAKAIQKYFDVNVTTGSLRNLSLRQHFMYGTQRNRLIAKIKSIRKKVEKIRQVCEIVAEGGSIDGDIALIQFFVLEQFSAYKRYALRHQFFFFTATTPEKIHPIIWMLGWGFVVGSFLFFLYWILAWAIVNGSSTFGSWGINFCLSVMEDILIIQICKVYVLYVMAMYSIRPQLNHIYQALNKLAVDYIQEGGLSIAKSQELRVAQHMSPACRAARLHSCQGLTSAKILNQVDDIDIEVCRTKSTKWLSLAFLLLLAPGALALIHFLVGDTYLETIIPAIFGSFLVANYFVVVHSVAGLVVIYVVLFAFIVWRCMAASKAFAKAKEAVKKKPKSMRGNVASQTERQQWIAAKRASHRKSLLNFSMYVLHCVSYYTYMGTRQLMAPFFKARKMQRVQRKEQGAWRNMNLLVTTTSVPNTNENMLPKRKSLRKLNSEQLQSFYGNNRRRNSLNDVWRPVSIIIETPLELGGVVHQKSTHIQPEINKKGGYEIPPEVKAMRVKRHDWTETLAHKNPNNHSDYLLEVLNHQFLGIDERAAENYVIPPNPIPQKQGPRLMGSLYRTKCNQDAKDGLLVELLHKHAARFHRDASSPTEEYLDSITQEPRVNERLTGAAVVFIVQNVLNDIKPELPADFKQSVYEKLRSWLASEGVQNDTDVLSYTRLKEWLILTLGKGSLSIRIEESE